MSKRSIVMLTNASRKEAQGAAQEITSILAKAGIEVLQPQQVSHSTAEVVLVLGGDGTILRGAGEISESVLDKAIEIGPQ